MTDDREFTKFDILKDPLIRQLMSADGVAPAELAVLMADVATRLALQQQAGGSSTPSEIKAHIEAQQFDICMRLLRVECSPTAH